jgi:hypothetical protein
MGALLRRHQLTTFFLFVFVLTWSVWVPRAAGVQLGVLGQLWTWTPATAAALAAALTGGRAAVGELGTRLVRWRVGWHRYLIVILGPAAFSLLVAGLNLLLGGSWAAVAARVGGETLLLLPVFFLLLALTDGLGEEPA